MKTENRAILRSRSSKLRRTPDSAMNLELSQGLSFVLLSYHIIRLSGRLELSSLGISGNESVDKSSLQDQDKQQISFFVIRFPMKYSDRLVTTAR